MSKLNYRLTNKATNDLIEIWDYTFETWSEVQAEKYYSQLTDAFSFIAENGEIGKNFSEIKKGLLGKNVGKHIVFYQFESENKIVIIRVLHERMDLKSRLQE